MQGFIAFAVITTLAAHPNDSTLVYRGSRGQLSVATPRIESPGIRIDGLLDEPEWARAAVLTGFTQYEPIEGVAADNDTEVRVFYAEDAIYFGVHAYDSDPARIRATLSERDRSAFTDDYIRIVLDTYGDQRQAYVFYVNPYGIQTDGVWQEGRGGGGGGGPGGGGGGGGPGGGGGGGFGPPIEFSQDFIWDSDGRIVEDGWVAEFRIPYVSIRFRETAEQDWGINAARETKRNGYKTSWAPLTKDRTNQLALSGQLTGLSGLRSRRLVEMNPVATGKRIGQLDDAGRFGMDGFSPELGINARIGVTQNLVANATYNPDFSQVEADADQLTANERFALFLQEKRPFFLEGSEVFRTPKQLVYTRSIGDPRAGAKMTGKLGAFNVGYLGALDDSPVADSVENSRAAFNVVRVQRDIGAGSGIGLLYADRTLTSGGAFNRVAGFDARFVFRERYSLTTQYGQSWTRDADSAVTYSGPMASVELQRSGRSFNWRAEFEDYAPDFRARSGFIRRVGDAHAQARAGTNFYGQRGSLIERFGVDLNIETWFDHDGLWNGVGPTESQIEIQPNFQIRGGNSLRFTLQTSRFRFTPDDYENYQIERADGSLAPFPTPATLDNMIELGVFPRLRLSNAVQLDGRFSLRQSPIYSEGTRGRELQIAPNLRLQPTDGLAIEMSLTRSRLWRSETDELFSSQSISRIKGQYQFTKALFARAILQYNLIDRDAVRDPVTGRALVVDGVPAVTTETGDFGINLLLSYQPSPGTLMYVGWARQMQGINTYTLTDYDRTAEGLFLKFSWLYRM